MPRLTIITRGDGCWPDLKGKVGTEAVIQLDDGFDVAMLDGGMQSGKTSIMFRLDLPDGRVVLAQTSLELLDSAVRAFKAAGG